MGSRCDFSTISRPDFKCSLEAGHEGAHEFDKDDAPIQQFDTGGQRERAPFMYDMIPCVCLRELAGIHTEGCARYGRDNWLKGIPYSVMFNHVMEHLMRWKEGDRSEPHLMKAAWGLMALRWYDDHHPECNDLRV